MLLAPTCPGCGAEGAAPCPRCLASMAAPPQPPCGGPLVSCEALLAYEGPAREVVVRLKYRNARASLRWLAAGMANLVAAEAVDVVTWAPTSAARRHARGFDQAELLAREVARRCALPCRHLLGRGPGPPQTGRTAEQRAVGPSFAVRRSVTGLSVLIVDDVITTGATVRSAASALVDAGAREVRALAAAHPP